VMDRRPDASRLSVVDDLLRLLRLSGSAPL
jgi:hypothetical protein